MNRSMFKIQSVLLVFCVLFCFGCGGESTGYNAGGSTLTLSANPTSINADGISFSTITAVLIDSNGNPALQGTQVNFITSQGYFANGTNGFQTVTDATGTAVAVLYAGTTASNDVTVSCTAGGLTMIVKLKFVAATPGPAANITLTASNQSINADGISSSALTAKITDNTGLPAAIGTAVTFTTNLGVFSNNQTRYSTTTIDEDGTAFATLIAGLTPGTATITCSSGNTSAIIRIEIKSF